MTDHDLRQDGIHLLLGITMTFAILGAIATLGGALFSVFLAIAPSTIKRAIQTVLIDAFDAWVLLGAAIQAFGWRWLPQLGFISYRVGQRMSRIMAGVALFMLVMVIVSL
jgi:hypothetical protein